MLICVGVSTGDVFSHGTGAARIGRRVVVAGDPAPVGHDAAVVLEVGEAVLDAPVVVVLVEVAETVLVVEGRPGAALTLSAMAARAVRVVELRALGERVHGVDDQVLMRVGLVEAETVAVVADDAADLVDAERAGRPGPCTRRSWSTGSRNAGSGPGCWTVTGAAGGAPGGVYGV